MATLSEELRTACADIRRKPYPIADLVPLLQRAADALDAAAAALPPLVSLAKAVLPSPEERS